MRSSPGTYGKCYISRVSAGLWKQTGLITKGVWEGAQEMVTLSFKDEQKFSRQKG